MPDICPPRDELARFSTGHLEDSPAEAIATHVDSCAECRTVLEDLSRTSDSLAAALRHPGELPFASEAALAAALPHVQEIRGEHSSADELTSDSSQQTAAISISQFKAIRDYEILEKLGEGGMGAVYKARHRRLKKMVALKVLPRDKMLGADAIARFEREMEAVGKLEHPNLVRAMDAGEADGTHFLVMEYVGGPDLSQLVKQQGPLRIADACELIRQAGVGLQHVHEQGLVHRDIKPSNLMLSPTGTLKILDLGLALLSGDNSPGGPELTTTGQMMGTIDYMAPEQGGDTHNVDIRADIYSLGATLYKLLTGVAPFGDPKFDTPVKKLMALATQEPAPVQQRRTDVPPALAAVVAKMLAKTPAKRHATPADVVKALTPFASGSDLSAVLAVSSSADSKKETEDTYPSLKSVSVDTIAPTIHSATHSDNLWQRLQRLPLALRILAATLLTLVFAGGAWLGAPIILYWDTPQGVVRIEIEDPAIQAQFDKDGLVITGADKKPIKIHAAGDAAEDKAIAEGKHLLLIKWNDREFETDTFELKKNGRHSLKIKLTQGQVEVAANGKSLSVGETKKTTERLQASAALVDAGTAPPPLQIPEPPLLDEWLKGRKVRTVAQDGSGEFKTIGEALRVIRPHEAVEVLDRGPYRESLPIGGLPADTGLVSKQQTLIELPAWETPDGKDVGWAISLGPIEGFRVSGFRFEAPARKVYGGLLGVYQASALVVEDCRFGPTFRGISFISFEPNAKPSFVRNCLFDNATIDLARGGPNSVTFVQNYFKKCGLASTAPLLGRLQITGNVFEDHQSIWLQGLKEVDLLEITNNTATAGGIHVADAAPPKGVVCRNNLTEQGMTVSIQSPPEFLREIEKSWQLGHNGYVRINWGKRPSDVLEEPKYLSTDPGHPDYLRLALNAPQATGGVGGALPKHIGALPPGPAPKEGDWFSRLRQRWGEGPKEASNIPPPLKIEEPPPLDEWLKGREVLTVAQDGKASFKTIQAALDALQPGQVIRVLDRGPYRERLHREHLPDGSGLISEQQTVLELPEWVKNPNDSEVPLGHLLGCGEVFRLHGFVLSFPTSKKGGHAFYVGNPNGLVFENCFVQAPQPNELIATVMFNAWGTGQTDMQPVWVRDCLFRGQLIVTGDNARSVTVIERNFIAGPGNQSIAIGGQCSHVVIRHNVLGGGVTNGDIAFELKEAKVLEVYNNTSLSEFPLFFATTIPEGKTSFLNNLRVSPGFLVLTQGAEQELPAVSRSWRVGGNAYPRALRDGELTAQQNLYPPRETDVVGKMKFLSLDALQADYLRLSPDSPPAIKGVGGEWPTYIGALPPGPAPKEGDWFTRLRDRWLSQKD